MVKVFNTLKEQYYPFEDYSEAMTSIGLLGRKRTITSITQTIPVVATTTVAPTTTSGTTTVSPTTTIAPTTTAAPTATFHSVAHGFVTGQSVVIGETIDYDGTYLVTVLDVDNFICDDSVYVADETSGEAYPLMDSTYYMIFLNDIETIFNSVKLFSAVRAKAIKDKNGNSMIDEFTLSEDRRDIFLVLAKQFCDKVFAKISAYAKGIQNAYIFNDHIDYDGDGTISTLEDDYMVHMAINIETTLQDLNIFNLIDQKIFDAIVYGILSDWFRTQGSPEDYMLYKGLFQDSLSEIGLKTGQAEGKRSIPFGEFF